MADTEEPTMPDPVPGEDQPGDPSVGDPAPAPEGAPQAALHEEGNETSDPPSDQPAEVPAADAAASPQSGNPDQAKQPSNRIELQMGLLDDVDVNVRVELGRTQMYVSDVLGLNAGSVIELDKLAGDPVDIVVNGKLLARGEVLVLNENFCVRITDIVDEEERSRGGMS